jgi:hypothetical protein
VWEAFASHSYLGGKLLAQGQNRASITGRDPFPAAKAENRDIAKRPRAISIQLSSRMLRGVLYQRNAVWLDDCADGWYVYWQPIQMCYDNCIDSIRQCTLQRIQVRTKRARIDIV